MFAPSCSLRAIDILRNKGWNEGRGYVYRQVCRCDGNYVMMRKTDGKLIMKTSDGCEFGENEMSSEVKSAYLDRERSYVCK